MTFSIIQKGHFYNLTNNFKDVVVCVTKVIDDKYAMVYDCKAQIHEKTDVVFLNDVELTETQFNAYRRKTNKFFREEHLRIIQESLRTNPKAVEKAVISIFSLQTASEKKNEIAVEENGVGFNRFDAEVLSNFAKILLNGRSLSTKQFILAKTKIAKYSKQLLNLALENNKVFLIN